MGVLKKVFGKNTWTTVFGVAILGLQLGAVVTTNKETAEKLNKVSAILTGVGLGVAADGKRLDNQSARLAVVEKKTAGE